MSGGGTTPTRYRSWDDDNARWDDFPFREGDIVVSTRSKSGTTWMQMICALLVFQSPELPEPLGVLSPWLDHLVIPADEVIAQLEAQDHRRIIKTHTPLDGLPIDDRATYLVVGRHPLDVAVSLYHQDDNLDRERVARLAGTTPRAESGAARPEVHDWLVEWIAWAGSPQERLDSLPGVLWHLSDAWGRRDQPNIGLVHYDDLASDLDSEMRRIAALLEIAVDEDTWPALVQAAGFEQMRARADELAPDPARVLKDRPRFFRQGRSGEGRTLLSKDDLAAYHARAAELAPPELLAWLHRERVDRDPGSLDTV